MLHLFHFTLTIPNCISYSINSYIFKASPMPWYSVVITPEIKVNLKTSNQIKLGNTEST